MKICTVAQMRAFDASAVNDFYIPEMILMENAGLAAVHLLKQHIRINDLKVAVICGPGNNGGDGLVVARQLASLHANVSIIFLNPPELFSGVSLINFEIVRSMNMPYLVASDDINKALTSLYNSDLIVDAIFGTGLSRPPQDIYAQFIQTINSTGKPVLSLDIPSGVNGDSGDVFGTAVNATWTVTFGLPKIGNVLFPGYKHAGKLYVSSISFPDQITSSQNISCEINLPPACPPRDDTGHKGTFGQALFIAGAASYYGAPYFSATAFLKAGGGYSRLAAPASIIPFIAAKSSELVFLPQKETPHGNLALENLDSLCEIANQNNITVLGPGVSLESETQELVRRLLLSIEKPVLLDGDGLTAISKDIQILADRQSPTILTPHPGEMARLLNMSVNELVHNPIPLVRDFCAKWNVALVLKGAHSIICLPGGKVFINMSGNCGMATAGSGDVLTGVIAAMYGLGMDLYDALRKGVFIHGFAGDLASQAIGPDGVIAGDILEFIPKAMRHERNGEILSLFPHYQGAIPI